MDVVLCSLSLCLGMNGSIFTTYSIRSLSHSLWTRFPLHSSPFILESAVAAISCVSPFSLLQTDESAECRVFIESSGSKELLDEENSDTNMKSVIQVAVS